MDLHMYGGGGGEEGEGRSIGVREHRIAYQRPVALVEYKHISWIHTHADSRAPILYIRNHTSEFPCVYIRQGALTSKVESSVDVPSVPHPQPILPHTSELPCVYIR